MEDSTELKRLLSRYPSEVQELTYQVRELVAAAIPGSTEMVDTSARVVPVWR